MSLDVYLRRSNSELPSSEPKIYVRLDGQTKVVSRAVWDELYPGREPVTVDPDWNDDEIYSSNITHNLNTMADHAGIYKHLWRPDEIGISKASELIEPLRAGLELLRSDPARFKEFNPENGWGNYDGLCQFVSDYLAACEAHPHADVSVSR